jgi:hypothetical protein
MLWRIADSRFRPANRHFSEGLVLGLLQFIGTAFDHDALQTQRLAREFICLALNNSRKVARSVFVMEFTSPTVQIRALPVEGHEFVSHRSGITFFSPERIDFWGGRRSPRQAPPTCGVNKIASRLPDRRVVFLAAGGYNAQ